MINYRKTRLLSTKNMAIEDGLVLNEEGYAMVLGRVNGQPFARKSTGAAGEAFIGFSYERTRMPEVLGMVKEGMVSDDVMSIDLGRTPNAGQIGVWVDGSKVTLEAGQTPSDANHAALEGQTLYFHAGQKTKAFKVQFTYTPTVEEARLYGEQVDLHGHPASAEVGVTGIIQGGEISVSLWDPASDWSDDSVMHPRLGANGLLTLEGNGTELKNLIIKEAPTTESATLTVEFIMA